MHQGRIVASGSPAEVKALFRYPLYRLSGKDMRALRRFFHGRPEVHATQLFGDAVHVSFYQPPTALDWEAWQQDTQGNLHHWEPQPPSMEDVFMEFIEDKT